MAQAMIIHAKKPEKPGEVKTLPPQMRRDRGPTFTSDGRLIEKMQREGKRLWPLLKSKYDMILL